MNQSGQQRTISRIVGLLCGSAGNAVIAFLTQILMTRGMTVPDYGSLVALIAVATLLTPVAGQCVGWFWLELYGREGIAAVRWGKSALRLCMVTMSVACFLLLGYIGFSASTGDTSEFTRLWMPWLCASLVLIGQTLTETRAVRLQLEERFSALALWQMAPQLLRSVVIIALSASGMLSGTNALLGYGLVGLIIAMASLPSLLAMARGTVRAPSLDLTASATAVSGRSAEDARASVPGMSACFRAALPYSLVTLFFLIYSTGILALVKLLLGEKAAAYYNVSFLIFTSLALLPSVVYTKFLASKIFRWWNHDRKMFVATFHLGVCAHLLLGLGLGSLIWLLAPWLVPTLFGARYEPAVAVLQILAVAVPIRFVQHGYGSVLFSKEHIYRKVSYMGIAALLSAILVLLLTPRYGVVGAAVSAVLAEFLLLLLYGYGAARYVEGIELGATFKRRTLVGAHHYATVRRGADGTRSVHS